MAQATFYCRFCQREHQRREALTHCDWPVPRIVSLPWKEIGEGDVWISNQKRLRGKAVGREPLDPYIPMTWGVRFWVKFPNHKDPYPYERHGDMTVETERGNGTCSAPCCFRHRRHIGPNVDYCMDHWNSWSER